MNRPVLPSEAAAPTKEEEEALLLHYRTMDPSDRPHLLRVAEALALTGSGEG